MADTARLAQDIVMLRVGRLATLWIVTLFGLAGFAFAMHALSVQFGTLWPEAELAPRVDLDDVRNPRYDEYLPPAPLPDSLLPASERPDDLGRALAHGLRMAETAYIPYNRAAGRVAEANGLTHMLDDVRRDSTMFDSSSDSWRDEGMYGQGDTQQDRPVNFTTYNTLSNV
jgi:hypothetical protein